MTPEEIEFYKVAVNEICKAWVIGAIVLAIGIGSISINNIFGREK